MGINHHHNTFLEHFFHPRRFSSAENLHFHPTPGNHESVFHHCNFAFCQNFMELGSQYEVFRVWLLSLSIMCLRFAHVVTWSEISSFFLLKSIPRVDIYLSVMGIWIVSSSGLLWIMLIWTSMHNSSCGQLFSFPLGRHLGVELFSHMINVCPTF